MMPRLVLQVALLLSCLAVGRGVADAQPVRDGDVQPSYGTASIAGVVQTDGAQPVVVRRAIVTVSGDGLAPSRGAVTDDEGRFAIGNLPAGRFTVTVAKGGYVTSAYGAKRAGRPGTTVTVDGGEAVEGLVVRIWRGAVVSGTLRDRDGAPVPGVRVSAIPGRRSTTGPLTLSNNDAAETDDRGVYRIFGLLPGEYVVAALPGATGTTATVARSNAEVDALLAALRAGVAGPAGGSAVSEVDTDPPPPFTYAPVYYPGTASVGEAQPVTLEPGQEASGLDFTLLRVPTSVVAGSLRLPDGQPAAGVEVELEREESTGFRLAEPALVMIRTRSDGLFEFPSVTPGQYRLLARAPVNPPAPNRSPGFVTPGSSGVEFWAAADISVSGSDIEGLSLTFEMPLVASGTVQFAATAQAPPDALAQYYVALYPPAILNLRPGTPIRSNGIARPASPDQDGGFEVTNLVPGTYRMMVGGPGITSGVWWPRSAMAGERDLLDGDVELTRASDLSNIIVTLTDERSGLEGRLQTLAGDPASDVFVIVFPRDSGLWGGMTRRVRAVRPGVDGQYIIDDLPPGAYLVAAVADVDEDDWQDAAFLSQLVPFSLEVSIGEGQIRTQDLQIGGGGTR